jgi:hypothetical protein
LSKGPFALTEFPFALSLIFPFAPSRPGRSP